MAEKGEHGTLASFGRSVVWLLANCRVTGTKLDLAMVAEKSTFICRAVHPAEFSGPKPFTSLLRRLSRSPRASPQGYDTHILYGMMILPVRIKFALRAERKPTASK